MTLPYFEFRVEIDGVGTISGDDIWQLDVDIGSRGAFFDPVTKPATCIVVAANHGSGDPLEQSSFAYNSPGPYNINYNDPPGIYQQFRVYYKPVWKSEQEEKLLFNGYLQEINPQHSVNAVGKVTFRAFGIIGYVALPQFHNFVPIIDNEWSGQMMNRVLDTTSVPVERRRVDAGQNLLNSGYVYQTGAFGRATYIQDMVGVMELIARAELGQVREDREGNIIFEDRYHRKVRLRDDYATNGPVAKMDDRPHAIAQDDNLLTYSMVEQIENHSFLVYNQFNANIRTTIVLPGDIERGHTLYYWVGGPNNKPPIVIAPGDTQILEPVDLTEDPMYDPLGNRPGSFYSFVRPWYPPTGVGDEPDWVASIEDPTDSSKRRPSTINVEIDGDNTTHVKATIKVTNPHSVPVLISKLSIRGTRIKQGYNQGLLKRDEDSINLHGLKAFEYPIELGLNRDEARHHIEWLLSIYKDPQAYIKVGFPVYKSEKHLQAVEDITTGKLVDFISQRQGIWYRSTWNTTLHRMTMVVEREIHRIRPGSWNVEYEMSAYNPHRAVKADVTRLDEDQFFFNSGRYSLPT